MESQSFYPHFRVSSYWIFLCLFHGFPDSGRLCNMGPYAGYTDIKLELIRFLVV
jgi:hypothetical protein